MSKQVFFGYPQHPRSTAEVMRATAKGIASHQGVGARTWEDLTVDGRVVIDEVLEAIDQSDMCVFDITVPNPNVLFEVGYAIGRAKPIWLALDVTNTSAKREWRELAILQHIGFTPYQNSEGLISRFFEKDPLSTLVSPYDAYIEPVLPSVPPRQDGILYCKTFEPFESANRLNNLMEDRQRRGLKLIVSDPAETSLSPLGWFVPKIAASAGVLISFAGESRNRAQVYNNRHAIVAGLSLGLEVPVLLLAEEDYKAPFDYEARMRVYETAEECLEVARDWLGGLNYEQVSWNPPRRPDVSSLAGLRFGEHVAENEIGELDDYFLATSAYHEVVAARDSIFIGHRGTGKTANAMQAFQHLASNKTNLAVLVKPPGFEFPAILAVIQKLPEAQHDYFFDSLWRFVIQTEIASEVLRRLERRPSVVPFSTDEETFLAYVDAAGFDMRSDVSERLEQALDALLKVLEGATSSGSRNLINEAFHSDALSTLRSQLGRILKDKKRVAVFVDNLDKGWERGADFEVMARIILGLLTARGRVVKDFQREDHWRDSVKLTVAVFLRSDIFTYLRAVAREPDKLPISTIAWRDIEVLRRLLEQRFITNWSTAVEPSELWESHFCQTVKGVPTCEYIFQVTLPRPRDVVFFCNAAVGKAIDRAHDKVEEADFLTAAETYSQYAYEALLVENGVTIPEITEALLQFLEAPAIDSREAREQLLRDGGIPDSRISILVDKMVSMSFFGLEVGDGDYVYPEIGTELSVAQARAVKFGGGNHLVGLAVHPAYHLFLGIV